MFVKRIVGRQPTQAEITRLEQVLVVERDAPSTVQELGQAVIVVGEVANDRGAPLVARRLQSSGELDSWYGGFLSWLGSQADGWEGNLYLKLRPLRFPELIVMVPDLEAGTVTLSATLSAALLVPAGTRLSDGGTSIWATLEDVAFVGTGYSESGSVRVRHVSGTDTKTAGTVTTIVNASALGLSGVTCTNAATLTGVDVEQAYLDAIDACANEGDPVVSAGTIIWSCRHTEAILAALQQHVTDVSSGGRGRIAVVSPPIGTSKATATGSAGVGAGAFASDRVVYAWPGLQWLFSRYSTTEYVISHADGWLASVIAATNPEESPGQVTPLLAQVKGVESGVILTRAFYEDCKDAGVVAYNWANGKACFYSAVTTSQTAGKEPIEQRRLSDMIQDSLALYLADYKDRLLTETNRNAAGDACRNFVDGLVEAERVEAGLVDVDSVNTPEDLAEGIFYISVQVRRFNSAKHIVLLAQIGTTVQITEE